MDTETCAPVTTTTLFPMFSLTKGITATIVNRLAERGLLDIYRPMCEYWPDFGWNGKEGIKLWHALKHICGLHNLPKTLKPEQLCDWDFMCGYLASSTPAYPLGQQFDYHALTYGWLTGQAARLATGKDFPSLLREEIGVEGIVIGAPEGFDSPVATLYEPDMVPVELPEMTTVPSCCMPMHEWMNKPETWKACLPAGNGLAHATAIAQHYAMLLPGGINGRTLLSQEWLEKALEPPPKGKEEVEFYGFGYAYYDMERTQFGHGGHGGSIGLADRRNNIAVGFMRNRLSHTYPTGTRLVAELIKNTLQGG